MKLIFNLIFANISSEKIAIDAVIKILFENTYAL